MCRKEAGLEAARVRASSVLTTSYGGAITSAALSGRGRSARKGRARNVIARLYARPRVRRLARSACGGVGEHPLDRVDYDVGLVLLNHVIAVARDDELTA